MPQADVIICGAGIAGISAAYHLAVHHQVHDVLLVDERPPMTLTSDKSSEGYRNWWPGPDDAMVRLMNHSIDLMEAMADSSGNRFQLNRRGYLYVTSDPDRIHDFEQSADQASNQGAGPVRYHTGQGGGIGYVPAPEHGYADQPAGADLILDQALIGRHFPYLSEDTVAVLHARRCGWLSGQQLGMYMLEQAQAHGVRLVEGRVEAVQTAGGRVHSVRVGSAGTSREIATGAFVNAAGPYTGHVSALLGIELPIYNELHLKLNFTDSRGVIPRQAPMVIYADPQYLLWSTEEREMLADSAESLWLLEKFPPAVHFRPDGGADSPVVLMLWPYHVYKTEPRFPIPLDPEYPEVVLRGMVRLAPGLSVYLEHMPKPVVDGGYYTKTVENRPLICPLPVSGAYVIAALSGFGIMASAAAGDLLAAHIAGSHLPDYASSFDLARYQDPAYLQLIQSWDDQTQL